MAEAEIEAIAARRRCIIQIKHRAAFPTVTPESTKGKPHLGAESIKPVPRGRASSPNVPGAVRRPPPPPNIVVVKVKRGSKGAARDGTRPGTCRSVRPHVTTDVDVRDAGMRALSFSVVVLSSVACRRHGVNE